MEDSEMNSVTPAAISDVKSESSVKDEPKLDVELGSEGEGTCFDVLDVVEESFDEVPTNYFSSEDDEANKVYSSGDSSSESGSPCQKMETAADGQSTAVEDDVDMEEVFETIDGDPDDYEECYVFERPPSPSDSPLPRGWKQVYHESGATIYVHVETNVCSLSRPYFLGPKSTKRHNVPTTPIPCLYYRSLQPSGNENLPAVAFDSSACEGNEASCPAEETASSSCADTCPAQSVIPTANSATTDANVTALEANATISNLNPITCPLNESSHAESAVTSDAEVANLGQNLATSDLILRNMNVATHYPKTGTLHTEVTVSDTNCHTCPMRAATYVENTNLATFSANPAVSSLDTTTSTSAPVTSTSSFSTDAAASTSTASPAAMHVTEPAFPNVTASTSSAIPSNEDEIFDTSCIADNAAMVADELPGDESGLLEYYKRLFKFKTIKYLKFHSWDVRRTYLRALRNERNRRRGPFSKNKFVSFPIETKDDEGNVVSTKKWIINPCGRNYVALLHEYLQQSKKAQPEYKFTEVDNARNPYAATVVVNETEYGTGFGMSKKEAKFEAAKATLEVLLPKMMKHVLSVNCDKTGNKKDEDLSDNDDDLLNVASAFDDIEITDPRVTELSLQTTELKPYELLLNCLQKKGEQSEVKLDFQADSRESTMSVGKYKVTVKCANKREGKQLAAQAMLQLLHPHIKNWGSLLRLYGNYITNQYHQVSDDRDMEHMKCKPANEELLANLRRRMTNLVDKNGG